MELFYVVIWVLPSVAIALGVGYYIGASTHAPRCGKTPSASDRGRWRPCTCC